MSPGCQLIQLKSGVWKAERKPKKLTTELLGSLSPNQAVFFSPTFSLLMFVLYVISTKWIGKVYLLHLSRSGSLPVNFFSALFSNIGMLGIEHILIHFFVNSVRIQWDLTTCPTLNQSLEVRGWTRPHFHSAVQEITQRGTGWNRALYEVLQETRQKASHWNGVEYI